ncbi:MAG: DNA polymerase III subunit gamma/tau [Mariprofundaceae bacterium]
MSNYLVLARRWRPQRFSELVGQDIVVQTLKNALNSHSLAHAYLLTGIRGVGKTTIARLMAMSVNCSDLETGEPCGRCESCVGIAAGNHLDVQEMDAASHTGVDDVREILEGVRYPPVSLPYKVYIIDEVHMLSKSAFNALLKTLEEPPERVLFILATTESEKLPVTVRSRCQRFDLRRLSVQEIADYLAHVLKQESVASEPEALLTIARAADGSVRDALSLTERVLAYSHEHISAHDVRQALGMVGPEVVESLADAIAAGDAAVAVGVVRQTAILGTSPRMLLETLSGLWHQLACGMVAEDLIADVPSEQTQKWLLEARLIWSSESLDLRYQVLLHGLRDLFLLDEQRGVEMIVMRLCHLKALDQPADSTFEPIQKKQDRPAKVVENHPKQVVSSEPDAGVVIVPGPSAGGWVDVVAAYAEIDPAMAAMLERVVCVAFDQSEVGLALNKHQLGLIAVKERQAFATWLGRSVAWDRPLPDVKVESISSLRERHDLEEKKRLWQEAESHENVQELVGRMDCELVGVQAEADVEKQ